MWRDCADAAGPPAAYPGVADSAAWMLKIEVVQNDGNRETGSGDEYRDLCLLSVPGFLGTAPPRARQGDKRVGAPVYAVGPVHL
jgi:hypothetical protein